MRKLVGLGVLLLAACGDDDPVRHLDGGPIDSPVEIDAPAGQPVTLTVTVNGTPQVGVKVYFQGTDSSLISNTLTDATGVASAVMPNGGFVTAVDPYLVPEGGGPSESHDLYTFSGVKPGDHLKLKDSFTATTQVAVTVPLDGDANVTEYLVSTPCDDDVYISDGTGAQPQVTLFLDASCATTTDFIVASRDAAHEIVHWFYVPNQAVAATLDLTGTYAAPTAKTYTYTNADAIGFVQIEQQFVSARGAVIDLGGTAIGKGPPYSGVIQTPNFADAIDVVMGMAPGGPETVHQFVDWGPFSATYTTDVGARILPDLSGATIDTTAHALTWTENGGAATPDFALAYVGASRTGFGFGWQIVAPHTSASIAFPTLPTDIGDFTIAETDSSFIEGTVLGKVPGGYDAIRADLFSTQGPQDLVTSAAGSITAAAWQPLVQKRRVRPVRTWPVMGIMRARSK